MDDLKKRQNEIDTELRKLPQEMNNAIHNYQQEARRTQEALRADYQTQIDNLHREKAEIDSRIRAIQRPVGSIF